jgi:hypothetical protein
MQRHDNQSLESLGWKKVETIVGVGQNFFTLPTKNQADDFGPVPDEAASINEFFRSDEGKDYRVKVNKMIDDLRSWIANNFDPVKDKALLTKMQKALDGFILHNFDAHPIFKSNTDATLNYNKDQFALLKMGVPILFDIIQKLQSETFPLALRKDIIRELAPELYVCGDGCYTQIEAASTKFPSSIISAMMGFRRNIAEQYAQQILASKDVQAVLDAEINGQNKYDINRPGFNIHNINSIVNALADELAIVARNDVWAKPISEYKGLEMCLPYVRQKCQQFFSLDSIVDTLLNGPESPLLPLLKDIFQNINAKNSNEKSIQLQRLLDSYGVDSHLSGDGLIKLFLTSKTQHEINEALEADDINAALAAIHYEIKPEAQFKTAIFQTLLPRLISQGMVSPGTFTFLSGDDQGLSLHLTPFNDVDYSYAEVYSVEETSYEVKKPDGTIVTETHLSSTKNKLSLAEYFQKFLQATSTEAIILDMLAKGSLMSLAVNKITNDDALTVEQITLLKAKLKTFTRQVFQVLVDALTIELKKNSAVGAQQILIERFVALKNHPAFADEKVNLKSLSQIVKLIPVNLHSQFVGSLQELAQIKFRDILKTKNNDSILKYLENNPFRELLLADIETKYFTNIFADEKSLALIYEILHGSNTLIIKNLIQSTHPEFLRQILVKAIKHNDIKSVSHIVAFCERRQHAQLYGERRVNVENRRGSDGFLLEYAIQRSSTEIVKCLLKGIRGKELAHLRCQDAYKLFLTGQTV